MDFMYEYTVDDIAEVCIGVTDLELDLIPDCPVEFPFDVLLSANGNVYLKLWKIELS